MTDHLNDYEVWEKELLAAANDVVDRWEQGDLADAVNRLDELLQEGGVRRDH